MADINWDTLSLEELKDIQKQAERAIKSFETRRKQEAIAAIQATAGEFGFSLNNLMGSGKGKSAPSAPKYSHPDNPNLTWSGRGRQPAWFKDALAAGKSEDELLIG